MEPWRAKHLSSTSFADYDPLTIDPEPSSSDASSTTTATVDTSASLSDTPTTTQTTPEIEDDLPFHKDTAKAAREDEAEYEAQPALTRRRSTRLRASGIHGASGIASPPQSLPEFSATPKSHTRSGKSPASSTGADNSAPEPSTPDVKPKDEDDDKKTRRQSSRTSALAAALKIHATPLDLRRTQKRDHDGMTDGSRSAGPKLPSAPPKKARLEDKSTPTAKSTPAASEEPVEDDEPMVRRRMRKKWIKEGLYVGQELDADLNLRPASVKKKGRGKKKERPPIMPLPMFVGERIINEQRDFKLPHFVFAPCPVKVGNIPGWRKLNHNQFIGDASKYWRKENAANIKCVCEDVCEEHCLNRCTWMECDNNNCNVGRHCKNRAFADLRERVKLGTKFAEGVEVFQTGDRGLGLRAMRSFEPKQIIVEYTGEIITQEESEHRLNKVYVDKKNMILDATRGSVARFVNHSCEPNCRMEKWLVQGVPRMALFAGDKGIEAGDELTYDYNFNWFKGVTQQSCKCGSEKCRGTLGKRSDAPVKKPEPTPVSKGKKKKGNGKGKWAKKMMTTTPVTKSVLSRTTTNATKVPPKAKPANLPKSVIVQPKPKRKPPMQRRPPTPSPAPSPVPSVSDSEEDEDISSPDRQLLEIPPAPTPAPPLKTRPRITRTYKVNKTIAQAEISKPVTSSELLQAARDAALADVLGGVSAGSASATSLASKPAKRTTRRLTIPGIPVLA
ncbi:hypothetical protein EX30DRAFT_351354 [Ascodesmis nigricans]|uniref:SET domain-containing protein n=1 Tax=Ascodesmis nigricans TaxID=341454 RepID=A0A4S2MRW5_9PEZI|nr:hypothetical protein EX30DRAFT_351354 [Ascodesmis nigricans]